MTSRSSNPITTSNQNQNSLDDIFGSSPPYEETEAVPQQRQRDPAIEPSELPFLRRQHVTAGYRDGISISKGEHVQRGFDAGFPVGAQLGMRAGTILGIIEGALRGYESHTGSAVVKKQPDSSSPMVAKETEADLEMRSAKREQMLKLYGEAVKELNVQAVFAGLDGSSSTTDGGEEGGKPEIQLLQRGDAVISAWEKRVRVGHWEENMDVLEAKDDGETENLSASA